MIALVGHEIARISGRRREANCCQDLFRRRKREVERRRVAFVGAVDRRRHNDARVEINRVLRFVREMCRGRRICRKFRVRAITMEKKETSYGETEATGYFRRAA